MGLVSGVSRQKFWQVVNGQVIHITLYWAKKVMVKVWDLDGLVDNQVECPPGLWVIINNHTTHTPISLTSEGLVIAHNGYRLMVYSKMIKASCPNTQVLA
jgi:hypothetical protein